MNLTVNGEPLEVKDGASITELLAQLDLGPGPVAVERNGDVVPRKEHPSTTLADGDRIEVVHFVGGG